MAMSVPTSRRSLLLSVGGLSAAAVAGCSSARVIGLDKVRRSLDICNGAEPLSLDPHKISGSWENNIVGNMFMGLTTENENSQPVPGMARSWEVSADGRTWTFALRRALWSDGEACDAHDFVFAFRRILNPAMLAPYASILFPIRNAEAVNAGQRPPEDLAVRALDDLTLEIELEYPAPYLPQLLKHYTAFPVPKHRVERHGEDWIKPENIVVNGPFILRRWWSNYIVHLARNAAFFDADNVIMEHLYYYPTTDVGAMVRRVMAKEAGWATRFPSNQVEMLRQELPGYPRVAPYLYCSYFSFNMTRAPFNDVRVRQALSMAYEREFVAEQIYRTGERPAYSLVPPGVANYPGTARYRWAERPIAERRLEAERLLRAAGYGPNSPLRFELSHRNTGDYPRVAVVVQDQWRSIAQWVSVQLRAAEPQVHFENLQTKRFECADDGWGADYNDAKNFLYLLETRTGAQNYAGYSNPEYDRLVRESDFEPDAEKRGELMARAEQLMLDEAPVCMSTFINSTNLVHPDLTGYQDNIEDIHRARWFGFRT